MKVPSSENKPKSELVNFKDPKSGLSLDAVSAFYFASRITWRQRRFTRAPHQGIAVHFGSRWPFGFLQGVDDATQTAQAKTNPPRFRRGNSAGIKYFEAIPGSWLTMIRGGLLIALSFAEMLWMTVPLPYSTARVSACCHVVVMRP